MVGARIGDYQIDAELGMEEMAVVYIGTHVVLPRRAAIKVMHPNQTWLRGAAIQMLREACILEALSHPGIPRVYECGVLSDRQPWTALELIDGVTVGSLIAGASLPIADLVVVLRDVADILDHANTRGVVHRRLTSDAIVRTPERRIPTALRNWGDASTLDTASSHQIHERDDIHALGVIAFRALTGNVPDSSVSTAERCSAAPSELTSLIDRMLATDPAARPHATEVRDRASWLSDTLELLPTDKPRWTPAYGISPDRLPPGIEDFSIRIGPRRDPG